uniref:C-type lectin domain-containing protein n=1 Tax=Anopheles minimus TaxID=112268 RepID=A0A182WE58_9DIPT
MKAALIALVFVGVLAVGLPTVRAIRYIAYKDQVNFFTAWQQCLLYGGKLASIETADQNALVLEAIKRSRGTGGWWISGTDIGLEGSWIWLSKNIPVGSNNGYVNFAMGEPTNSGTGENCLAIEQSPLWNDLPCEKLINYVCEYN